MYLSHYSFSAKPFQITADPASIWLGEKHAEALATLQYGLQENNGFLLLTGDVGTGKTTVLNTFLKNIDEKVIAVMIPDPGLDPIDLYNILSAEFRMNRKFSNKGDFLNHLKPFLYETYLQSKTILLIIDEAQNISYELLEEIRLLSNIELADAKLINVFIVGQNEFNAILNEDRNRAFKQRIGIRYHLDPLNDSETHEYINHRLKAAGSHKEIFSSRAIAQIHLSSAGFPRLINAIGDRALLTGYSSGKDKIDENIIKECARELELPGEPEIIEQKKIIGDKNELRQSYIIYFQNASKELSPNSIETLAGLSVSIRDYPNSEIIIEGHTDSQGNYWRNKKLSRIRTKLVKNYFVNNGIIASRIKTMDLGAEYPKGNNDTATGGKMNHRVEIKIISPQRNLILSES